MGMGWRCLCQRQKAVRLKLKALGLFRVVGRVSRDTWDTWLMEALRFSIPPPLALRAYHTAESELWLAGRSYRRKPKIWGRSNNGHYWHLRFSWKYVHLLRVIAVKQPERWLRSLWLGAAVSLEQLPIIPLSLEYFQDDGFAMMSEGLEEFIQILIEVWRSNDNWRTFRCSRQISWRLFRSCRKWFEFIGLLSAASKRVSLPSCSRRRCGVAFKPTLPLVKCPHQCMRVRSYVCVERS